LQFCTLQPSLPDGTPIGLPPTSRHIAGDAAMKDAVLQLAGPAYTPQEQPDGYVRRLEAACQLLHEGLRQTQATGAQAAFPGPSSHKAAPAAAAPTPSATGIISAGKLCTLLLTDQDLLDVVLALHDVRAAQLCHLMPWSGSHALKLPPPSGALAKQLSQSQRSVPGSQLLAFVSALDSDNSLEGNPLLRVWDSMHRAMLLVLAALQSLPIRPHPQHPDPAATTHNPTTPQLPPGYHRCSACLLLSLRLATCLAQHCVEQPLDKDLALARLHATLPGLLLGLSTAVTVMQAAGHPEAKAQRVQFVRCMLHLGQKSSVTRKDPKASKNSSSRHHGSSRGHVSSRGPRGGTGRSGAPQSAGVKPHALAVDSYMYLAQALCDVFGRQEEVFAFKELITTCQEEGPDSSGELWTDVTNFGGMALMVLYEHSTDLSKTLKDPARGPSHTNARVAASRRSAAEVSVPLLMSESFGPLMTRNLAPFQSAVIPEPCQRAEASSIAAAAVAASASSDAYASSALLEQELQLNAALLEETKLLHQRVAKADAATMAAMADAEDKGVAAHATTAYKTSYLLRALQLLVACQLSFNKVQHAITSSLGLHLMPGQELIDRVPSGKTLKRAMDKIVETASHQSTYSGRCGDERRRAAARGSSLHTAGAAWCVPHRPLIVHKQYESVTKSITADGYVRRLEAACQLLHEGLRPTQATATPTPSATGIIPAGKLCTLLLTDQELLDVVLALHDVRAAQLCHLMPWSGSHALKLPPPSEALAKQLSQSQRSVPGSQLLSFVKTLGSDNSLEGDPLLCVWDSMHRAMLLVLAALQSLPIRPHPQHPDPAATTHTSTTPQLPPGYHRCSACLLLSLRLATCLAQHCGEQPLDKDLALARLHATLPGLLLGLSTAVTVMQAAGHPEAKAQRVQFVRCMLHLGQKSSVTRKDPKASKNSSSRHHGSSRGHVSSRGPRGGTGRSGAPQSAGVKPHALAVDSYMYLAQALCDVFGRQEEVFAFKELITTCQEEGPDSSGELWTDVTNFGGMALMVLYEHSTDLSKTLKDPARGPSHTNARVAASRRSAAEVSVPLLMSDILSFLARFLPEFRAARVTVELAATIGQVGEQMAEIFLTGLSAMYAELYQAVVKLTGLMPDWRRRPAVLRAGLRVAIAGALAHHTMVSLVPYMEDTAAMAQRLPEMEAKVSYMSVQVTHLWCLVLAQDGVNDPPTGPFRMDGTTLPSPPSPQLAPLALDLVLGMEHSLQMVMRQQDRVWKWPFWNEGSLVQSLVDGYRTLLALFGHVIEVLATPSVVGPAGLAASPASWLPCGNSLVEGWCTRLIERVCDLLYIATPASKAFPFILKIMLSRGLQDSYRLLLRGQRQAPPSMSPEAERLLACLTLVLTAMVPQELCLALAQDVKVRGLDKTLEKERRAMGVALSKLQPEQVWTWQALAAGTPAEPTLQGSLPALAALFGVQSLVRPIPQGWRPQRLTLAMDGYVRRLEAACQLLHEGLAPTQATGAQTAFPGPSSHKAAPGASHTPSAADQIAARKLCTLLLTDQEVLDVVLALHDVRAAQLCHLMPWSGSHPLKLPPPSEALAKQLSQSQRSVPGSQLLSFVRTLNSDNSLEGDPLLRVWDSMHRAMLLVLAALQSLPIRPHPQHPDPAATTHTSTTPQLPPGYHRCSACLLLSLRLATCLAQHCVEQPLGKDLALARLHGTLPGLLLGLSTSVTVMQAAGHPEAKAQRVQFVRCMLHLGLQLLLKTIPKASSSNSSSSRHHGSSRGQASSRRPLDEAGRSGAAHSAGDKLHALAVNSYVYLAQALCDVFGRQEEVFVKEFITTCQEEVIKRSGVIAKCVRPTALPAVQEEQLWDLVVRGQQQGVWVTKTALLAAVRTTQRAKELKGKLDPPKGRAPGNKWRRVFLRRQGLSLRKATPVTKRRRMAARNINGLVEWFEKQWQPALSRGTHMMDGRLFPMLLDVMAQQTPGGVSPTNRLNNDPKEAARVLGFDLVTLPAQCTSFLQPWDQLFGSVKAHAQKLLREAAFLAGGEGFHLPGGHAPMHYSVGFSMQPLQHAFKKTGLHPPNKDTMLGAAAASMEGGKQQPAFKSWIPLVVDDAMLRVAAQRAAQLQPGLRPDSIELWKDTTNFGGMAIMVLYQHSADLHETLKDAARASSRANAASRRPAMEVSVPLPASDILSLLNRFLSEFLAARVAVDLAATMYEVGEKMAEIFLTGLSTMYVSLYQAVVKLMGLMPDWRRRPAVLRPGLRVAIAGALAHNTVSSVLPYLEGIPAMAQRLPEMEAKVSYISTYVTHLWSLVLAQDGVYEPPTGPSRINGDLIHRMTMDRVAVLPSPSSPQLAPLALDLVLGMENTLQMVMQQQDMVWKWPFWNEGNLVQSLLNGYRTLLALFGHVIEVLATPSVVGPAGLAAQPASWLPCGNSLVEGWCTSLIERVCDLLYIATPASKAFPFILKIMLSRGLQDSYRLLLRGQRQAPPSMSPEAERLLACLTLVLTAMVPQELCLAFAGGVKVRGLDKTLEKEGRAMRIALSKLQPEQVWTWQALAAGTPAEVTLQGSLPALAALFGVQSLQYESVTEIITADGYVRRLEAACQLLHEGLRPTQATGAQTAFPGPSSHNAAPGAPHTPSAADQIAARKLCTLLLTDQEVLDVVLALHDARAAQLCHLMPWSGSHPLKLPPPSEALAKQLSKSQRSVPGSQLLSFVETLNSDNSLEGNPLLRVWDSMHRAMLLVLAALQSLPIRPHPQHPDPAATAHTSTTPQLPPGYHRCSACLLLSLRLATCLAQHCGEQPLGKDLALARLHATLPGLLLGLSTAVTVMQAAGHPEAQAQRVQFVRCMLHLGSKSFVTKTDLKASSKNSSSSHNGSSRGQVSSRRLRGETGRSGAAQSAGDKPHALTVDSYVYLAQALCDVFGRQEEVFVKEFIDTCQEEGPSSDEELWKDVTNFGGMALLVLTEHSVDLRQTLLDAARATSCTDAGVAASRHFAAEVSSPLLVSDILSLLARFLPEFRAARVAVELVSRIGYANQRMAEIFLTNLSALYVTLHQATVKLTGLMPDWRYRPAVLRTGLRVAIAGALAHNTMASLFPYLEDNPAMVQRMPAIEAELSAMSSHVAHLWSLVLAQDGVNAPPARPLKLDGDLINRMTMDRVAVLPSPSSPQLVPLALHLVLGMENMLQMVMRHQEMVWKWPYWNDRNSVQSLVDGYRTLLALFGHVIEVLATPSVVGPAGLAAQPASWLPCGNSLVEGWSTSLIERVCDLLYIATPASEAFPLKIMLSRGLQDSYRLLLRGQRQAPSSMSPEAERLLACLTLVLTAMVPQELCLALAQDVKVRGLDMTLEKERRAMGVALSKLQPEQVWTWQALAAGTPAEVTLQGSLPALAALFGVHGLASISLTSSK
ncbi:hypothetical protein QJQ45_019387, partial [Haematococcus lacustris]